MIIRHGSSKLRLFLPQMSSSSYIILTVVFVAKFPFTIIFLTYFLSSLEIEKEKIENWMKLHYEKSFLFGFNSFTRVSVALCVEAKKKFNHSSTAIATALQYSLGAMIQWFFIHSTKIAEASSSHHSTILSSTSTIEAFMLFFPLRKNNNIRMEFLAVHAKFFHKTRRLGSRKISAEYQN